MGSAEDPDVFVDSRGNYHILVNALPGGCHPQESQGGHAWSRDGVTWSEPRVGAYNETITFLNGTSMTCRRERPQMILDSMRRPIGMTSGIQCPNAFGYFKGAHADGPNSWGDCMTVVQMLNGSQDWDRQGRREGDWK